MPLMDILASQLGYAWLDDDIRQKLTWLMQEASAFFLRYDSGYDPESDAFDRSLMIEYVRYALANSRDDFKTNYGAEIRSVHDRGRVRKYMEESDAPSDD